MKLPYLFAAIVLCANSNLLQAQSTPINTVPEGITTFQLPLTAGGTTSTSFFSAPLVNDPVYTGAVQTITSSVGGPGADTINVGDSPFPWTGVNLGTAAAPYFVKFLTGAEIGRVLLIYSNTANSLTVDVFDGTGQQGSNTIGSATLLVNSPATSFDVQPGDTFEVFPGDTLALMFGLDTTQSPLMIGKGNALHSDSVSLFDPKSNQLVQYYFNSVNEMWQPTSSGANANNTLIRPYSGFAINRHGYDNTGKLATELASSFVLTGRVAEVNHTIKTVGSSKAVVDSSGYPVDVALSALHLTNWVGGAQLKADTISIWDSMTKQYDVYYIGTTGHWVLQGGDGTSKDSVTIPAATTVVFTKKLSATGSTSFVQPLLPYSLTN